MCGSCWVRMGRPTVWNQGIAEAAELITRLYELDEMFGPLHVVLEDWNLEDHHIKATYVIPAYGNRPESPDDYSQEIHELCDRIVEMLRAMPMDWRGSVLAHVEKIAIEGRVVKCSQTEIS